MQLALNEDQIMLKDSAARFLSKRLGPFHLRHLRDTKDERGYDQEAWQEIADLGWIGVAVNEEFGGLGFGYLGLGLILEEIGRNLSISPFQSTVLAGVTAINMGGSDEQKKATLPDIIAGKLTLSLALQEGRHHAPADISLEARSVGGGYLLSGTKLFVQDAHMADRFIIAARTSGQKGDKNGISLFLVDAQSAGLRRERAITVDSRNSGTLYLDDVKVTHTDRLGAEGEAYETLSLVLDVVNIGLSAELLGISLEAFDRTVEYLRTRKQFGHFIGAFQGLQHRAAAMYSELEIAKSYVRASLKAIDEGDEELPILAAATKAKLSQVSRNVTAEAIQMHGGIGMTDEFDIGLFLKRARAAQNSFGGYSYHLDRFARLKDY